MERKNDVNPYLYSTSTKLSIDVWLYLDRPGSLISEERVKNVKHNSENLMKIG